MSRAAGIVAGLVLLAAPASAAPWSVDYAKSSLGFTVLWSKEPFMGSFKSWKAAIEFDPANLAASRADVTVALASETSDEPDVDAGLKGDLGFAAARFPMAHFVARNFSRRSGNRYVARGTLSLKGVTKDVTLPFTLAIDGKSAHMTGTAVVMRNAYGVGSGLWAAPDPVAYEVKVNIDIVATAR